jgi:opine dehydrogenase
MTIKKAAVLGGGNGSHTIAADLTLKGLSINMFEMEQFADSMQTVFATREIEMSGAAGSGKARLNLVTSDIAQAIHGVEVIFMPLPGFTIEPYAKLLAPHLQDGQAVILLPGTFSALELLTALRTNGCKKDIVTAETGGLPFATRLVAPGKVKVFHIRAILALATMPGNRCQELYEKVKGLYAFAPRPTVIETGFNHLTPLLHPVGTLLNAGRIERSHGDFYMYEEGMTPGVVRVVEAVDRERLAIGAKLGVKLPTGVDLMVESAYGPRGTLWESINGSAGLTPVRGPDSLSSRYLTEDVPFSLAAWASMGHAVGVPTPVMDGLVEIGGAIMGVNPWEHGRSLKKMGLEGIPADQMMKYLETGSR